MSVIFAVHFLTGGIHELRIMRKYQDPLLWMDCYWYPALWQYYFAVSFKEVLSLRSNVVHIYWPCLHNLVHREQNQSGGFPLDRKMVGSMEVCDYGHTLKNVLLGNLIISGLLITGWTAYFLYSLSNIHVVSSWPKSKIFPNRGFLGFSECTSFSRGQRWVVNSLPSVPHGCCWIIHPF